MSTCKPIFQKLECFCYTEYMFLFVSFVFIELIHKSSVVQLISHVRIFAAPWTAACQASLSFTILEFAQTHVHRVGDAILPPHPLPSPSPPAFNLSQYQGLFQWVCIRWPKYWSFSFSINPSNEDSGLISFRINWFDLLVAKGLSKVFSSTIVQNHQFFGTQPFLFSSSHICTWLLEKSQLWLDGPLLAK